MSKPDILERLMDYDRCHEPEDVDDAAAEIKKLRCEVAVLHRRVHVAESLRLTDAEREAVERAAVWMMTLARDRREMQSAVYLADDAATLRGLRERHAP